MKTIRALLLSLCSITHLLGSEPKQSFYEFSVQTLKTLGIQSFQSQTTDRICTIYVSNNTFDGNYNKSALTAIAIQLAERALKEPQTDKTICIIKTFKAEPQEDGQNLQLKFTEIPEAQVVIKR